MGAAQSTYLATSHASDERRKAQAKHFSESKRGQRMMNSRGMREYIEKREKELGKGVDLRRQQESDTTKGERVWFSRCILNGTLQHWVLITHEMKYELRPTDLVKEKPSQGGERDDTQAKKGEQYVCNIKPYTIDQEQRDLALTELLIPEVDGYYICLIGWTQCTKEQVVSAAHDVLSTFGKYSLLRSDCQDFLRQLSNQIMIKHKAADYPWFISNTKTAYQKDQWLKPPPGEILMKMLDGAKASSMNIQTQLHMQHQHQYIIETQMQQQFQDQLQLQLQQQMQNQLQVEIQNQIIQ